LAYDVDADIDVISRLARSALASTPTPETWQATVRDDHGPDGKLK